MYDGACVPAVLPWLVRPQQLGSEWPICTISPLHGDDRSFNAHTKIVFQQALTAVHRSKTAACQPTGKTPGHWSGIRVVAEDPSPPNSVPTTRVVPTGRDAQCARNEEWSIFCFLFDEGTCVSATVERYRMQEQITGQAYLILFHACHPLGPSWTKQKGC